MVRVLSTAALLFVLSSSTAAAPAACGVRGNMVGHLGKQYGESRIALGLESRGRVVEVLTSRQGSWSIIMTTPDGTTCLVAAGKSWRPAAKAATAPEL